MRIAPILHLQPSFTPPVGRRSPSAAEPRVVEAARHPVRPLNHLDLPFSQALARHNAERPDIHPIPYWAVLEQARRLRDALLVERAIEALGGEAAAAAPAGHTPASHSADVSTSPSPVSFPFPRIGAVTPLPPRPIMPAPSPYPPRPHATRGRLIDAVV